MFEVLEMTFMARKAKGNIEYQYEILLFLQKKAKLSHEMLDKYAVNELPLYNQPSDTDLYHKNKRK